MKRTHLIAAASLALVAGLALAGCSVIPSGSGAPSPAASSAPRGFGGAGGAGGMPGVSGQVAEVDGSTAQVQSTQSQTAVTWTDTTTFTDQVSAAASDVAVGDCIVARPATTSGGSTSGSSGTVAAATIEITPKTDGRCTPTGFGSRQVQPGVRPTPAPGRSDGSGDRATPPAGGSGSGFGGRGLAGFGATGEVTAVGDGTLTVSVERFARSGAATPAPSASPTTTSETVTFTSATTFTALRSADSAAVKVGTCVTALGTTDDTGALTATSVAVSLPVEGACSSGFAGRGGNGSRGGNGAGTTNG
jgi:hypothetical protein